MVSTDPTMHAQPQPPLQQTDRDYQLIQTPYCINPVIDPTESAPHPFTFPGRSCAGPHDFDTH